MLLAGTQPGSAALKELEDYVLQYVGSSSFLHIAHKSCKLSRDCFMTEPFGGMQRQAWVRLLNTFSVPVLAKLLAIDNAKPPLTFKESMVTVMHLSPDQKRDILNARHRALEEVEGLKNSRRAIAGTMIKASQLVIALFRPSD